MILEIYCTSTSNKYFNLQILLRLLTLQALAWNLVWHQYDGPQVHFFPPSKWTIPVCWGHSDNSAHTWFASATWATIVIKAGPYWFIISSHWNVKLSLIFVHLNLQSQGNKITHQIVQNITFSHFDLNTENLTEASNNQEKWFYHPTEFEISVYFKRIFKISLKMISLLPEWIREWKIKSL